MLLKVAAVGWGGVGESFFFFSELCCLGPRVWGLTLLNYRMLKEVFANAAFTCFQPPLTSLGKPKPEHGYKNPSARIADTDSPFPPPDTSVQERTRLKRLIRERMQQRMNSPTQMSHG